MRVCGFPSRETRFPFYKETTGTTALKLTQGRTHLVTRWQQVSPSLTTRVPRASSQASSGGGGAPGAVWPSRMSAAFSAIAKTVAPSCPPGTGV